MPISRLFSGLDWIGVVTWKAFKANSYRDQIKIDALANDMEGYNNISVIINSQRKWENVGGMIAGDHLAQRHTAMMPMAAQDKSSWRLFRGDGKDIMV